MKGKIASNMNKVGVIGAGISGLTAAYRLRKKGVRVQILESSSRAGGVIWSEMNDGFLVEHGPNSIRAGSEELEHVLEELDLQKKRVWADEAASTRYVVRDGRPIPLPSSVGSFLSTDLFSTRAKLRLLAEPFVGREKESIDESVASFTRRRLGPEILDYAVAPFVAGVFAGSPDDLSLEHAFPRLASLERENGSLFLGALKRALGSRSGTKEEVPSGLFSFRKGLHTLPDALADALENRITYDVHVDGLKQNGPKWKVHPSASSADPGESTFDALICTIPLHRLTALDFNTPVDLQSLEDVSYPPLSVLALGYPRDSIGHPLDGFGLLVPPSESELNILGTLFSSTLFPDRAPDDHVLLTSFVGGARNPEKASLSTDQLQALVEQDLDRLFGTYGEPTFRRHIFWDHAIPQYRPGYGQVKETLSRLEEKNTNLAFAGNYRQGVSVADALESGVAAADRIADGLEKSPR